MLTQAENKKAAVERDLEKRRLQLEEQKKSWKEQRDIEQNRCFLQVNHSVCVKNLLKSITEDSIQKSIDEVTTLLTLCHGDLLDTFKFKFLMLIDYYNSLTSKMKYFLGLIGTVTSAIADRSLAREAQEQSKTYTQRFIALEDNFKNSDEAYKHIEILLKTRVNLLDDEAKEKRSKMEELRQEVEKSLKTFHDLSVQS